MTTDCEGTRLDDVAGACVEQGPAWLVEWTVEPPTWLYWATLLAIVGAVAVLAYAAWRVDVEEELVEEVCETLLVIGCIAGATSLLVSTGRFGYATDVVLGTVSGYCTAQAALYAVHAGTDRVGGSVDPE